MEQQILNFMFESLPDEPEENPVGQQFAKEKCCACISGCLIF